MSDRTGDSESAAAGPSRASVGATADQRRRAAAVSPQTRDRALLMGNEAIARGALEAGVGFCAGYPGNPSSEIIDTLLKGAAGRPIHVEWSVNEIVALEAAAGAAFAGMRALVSMKQNGLNVCADFLTTVNLSGTDRGGLVVVVCDDPGPLTSSNEEDSRLFAPLFMLPLLEPATPQQAKDMTAWALACSQEESLPILVRSVSRLSHGRAGVILGTIPDRPAPPVRFEPSRPLVGMPGVVAANHARLHAKLARIQEDDVGGQFNSYRGPDSCDLLVIASGLCSLYAEEAITLCGLREQVGLLSLGVLWPFPRRTVLEHLREAGRVLVVEQIDPFVEDQVKLLHSDHAADLGGLSIVGKGSGHVPSTGEVETVAVVRALEALRGVSLTGPSAPPAAAQTGPSAAPIGLPAPPATASADERPAGASRGPSDLVDQATWTSRAREVLAALPPRDIAFCQACPHRASFWAIKTALALDGRRGVVAGDIGCYGLAAGPTGFSQLDTLHCMGAGLGVAGGMGVLGTLGFEQPVVAVAGDSTFYHACIPALINARMQGASLTFVILDNSTTAMTGFQPHPGSPCTPLDPDRLVLPPEDVCRGLGIETRVVDPVDDVRGAARAVFESLQEPGLDVLVFRRACSTWEKRIVGAASRKAFVQTERCVGEACGCDRFCARVLGCPGNRWDEEAGRAFVDPDYCDGCGLCVDLCPQQALVLMATGSSSSAVKAPS